MFAKINHIAIVSSNYLLEGKFYEAIFGMKFATGRRGLGAVTVRDGYVGLNINPRSPGRPGGLDHFGVEVDDVESVFARMQAKYPQVKWLKRPSTRPFAAISTHDPDGNVFDLSQKDSANRDGLYAEADAQHKRFINHYAIRTVRPELCAEFYRDVLELTPTNRRDGDPNHYLTDGRVTLEIMPWDVQVFDKTGIVRPGPDHIGFKVEDAEAVKNEIEALAKSTGPYGPWSLTGRDENAVRGDILRRSCPMGTYQFCDNDGVMFDIAS
jgi:catechol 2,3-dioxygenase-like lactoylglutathione lyase family enzyme